jgi:ubiquinone/menaquinone biosynthesis C-methylase UbiE
MLQRLDNRAQARKLRNIRLVLGKAGSGLLARDYFDRALLVTVLGEIPAPLAALREIYLALKPGGFLTVTEMIPDPHYQTKAVVERMAVETGFQTSLGSSSKLGYSMRLYKPLAHSGEAMI